MKNRKNMYRSASVLLLSLILCTAAVSPARAEITTALSDEQSFTIDSVPAYSSDPVPAVEVNNNLPYFQDADLTTESYESYSKLDDLGRCGEAVACIGTDIMPTQPRGEIGSVKPSGWHLVKYDGIDGNYLYNRCHLIAYQLSGENANDENLITGTRYLNVQGMLPYENEVADYVRSTGNHVLYRVTPIFEDDNLLASGVLMEAESVEDDGAGLSFNVYCYDVQPGITIDYATGDSSGEPYTGSDASSAVSAEGRTDHVPEDGSSASSGSAAVSSADPDPSASGTSAPEVTYIINTNTGKFHLPGCSSIGQMNEENKLEYTGSEDDLIAQGYQPCKRCLG